MESTLSVVIPALNEVHNMAAVLDSVPHVRLMELGWDAEVIVVDNGSSDGTGELARALGARVVDQPRRGYGNAYKAGFAAAGGEIIVTGDADRTYPFDHLPSLLTTFQQHGLEFLTTNRLLASNRGAMSPSHSVGNHVLSVVSRFLFRNGVVDSQSGMWMFRRDLWPRLDVRSAGMAFSQELKNEAFRRSDRCLEVPIEYRPRGGDVKLSAARDGVRNGAQLVVHRFRRTAAAVRRGEAPPPSAVEVIERAGPLDVATATVDVTDAAVAPLPAPWR